MGMGIICITWKKLMQKIIYLIEERSYSLFLKKKKMAAALPFKEEK
jgi:hypothetical protein